MDVISRTFTQNGLNVNIYLQDCHGSVSSSVAGGMSTAPVQDDTQNYIVVDGFQNSTHTQVEFYRDLETCDPYDLPLSVSKFQNLGNIRPIYLSLSTGHFHCSLQHFFQLMSTSFLYKAQ